MPELDPELYTVAWIAPLEIEARAALHMMDNVHHGRFPMSRGDDYVFRAGDISGHNIIVATLPADREYGTGSAAALASQVKKFFPNLWFGLLVGVAAGLPSPCRDIRLGDVLVALSEGESAGLVAYELGKETTETGFQLLRYGYVLATTETVIQSAIGSIKLYAPKDGPLFLPYYEAMKEEEHATGTFLDPGQENDKLYITGDHGTERAADRPLRPISRRTRVWYGPIGSGEKLMKNARKRDELRDRYNLIGLEMEAAGVINRIPVGVIRGVCDYGDKHKNKKWQPYAAAMAAAYAKAVLAEIPAKSVPAGTTGNQTSQPQSVFHGPITGRNVIAETTMNDQGLQAEKDGECCANIIRSLMTIIKTLTETACLRSLAFSDLHARQHDIAPAHPDTCDWLFQTPEFQQWRDPARRHTHNGVLWIKGKPGAGKSTLMKHTLSRCQTDFFDDHLIVAYFFNARGSTLEKTPLGLVRSITYQLLRADDALYTQLAPSFREKQRLGGEETWQWRLSELQDFIRLVVNESQSRPLLLLVDALDECDESDVRSMVEFLELLSICASKDGIPLRVCLSSRHYPSIRMATVAELAIDRSLDHHMGITKYIRERLRVQDVDIEAEIAQKADSVFLWVVIVVSLLNKAYDEGRVEAMRRTLEEIPGDLDRIFSTILGRDTTDAGETILMLQWVLLSQRPLHPRELFAATIRTALPAVETIKRRITTSSKGLIEVRKRKNDSVQFIHLSVSDFLFRTKRLQMLDPTLGPEPVTASHGRLWAQCWSCIQQVDTTQTSRQQMIEQHHKNPFLGYAVRYIFDHAERALSSHVTRQKKYGKRRRGEEAPNAATPRQVPIHQWLRGINHWFQWWKLFMAATTADNSEKHKLEWELDVELVYILARYRLPSLLGVVLEGADVNAQGGYYGNALQAASVKGHREIVQLLLDAGAEVNAQGGEHGSALQAASFEGQVEIVRLLLNANAEVNAQSDLYGSALQAASYNGHQELMQLLLNAGAEVNAQGGYYGNALQAASMHENIEVVQLLLDAGAEVNAQGGHYGSALQAASFEYQVEIVQLLLNAGAEVTAGKTYGVLPADQDWTWANTSNS